MIEKIDKDLLDLQIKIKEKTVYQSKLQKALVEKQDLMQQKVHLTDELKKEKKDVSKLEKASLSNIWYSLLGSKLEKLKKEKEEYSQVEYNYKLLTETINRIEEEIQHYRNIIGDINLLKNKEQELLKEKEQFILENKSSLYHDLINFNKEILEIEQQQNEIKEAVEAGNQVKSALETINKFLEKARGWGTWDMFGGGLISTMAKHSNIDEAKAKMTELHYLLKKFSRELNDVNQSVDIEIDISGTLKFADYFFDGFISDMMVQSRINRSIDQVKDARHVISHEINKLENQFSKNVYRKQKINETKNQLLNP